jgi:putative flippase GtrA
MARAKTIEPTRALRFGLTGIIGFIVDAGTLALLLKAGLLDPFSARLVAITVALLTTWMINRSYTFAPSGRSLYEEIARYGMVGFTGSALNYAIYAAILLIAPQVWPVAAVVCASAIVTVFSWLGYSKFVFQNR